MQRAALALVIWGILLTSVAGLAALARPASGPPMPRAPVERRAHTEALVPESDVTRAVPRRSLSPDELSQTVAPVIDETAPAVVPAPAVEPAAGPATGTGFEPEPDGNAAQGTERTAASTGERDESRIPGLGALPPGVPAEEEGLGVLVVRPDGQTVVDAQVRWLMQSDLDALRAQGVLVDELDPADLLTHSTRTARTNYLGFAMLTSERGAMVVDARHGDQYGCARIQRSETGHLRLPLALDTRLDVEVVDGAGRPRAGAGIVLRGGDCQPIWDARTDASGRATLRHADGAVRAARARFQDLSIAVDVPGGDLRVLPRGQMPAEPVRLVADPGVRVVVWVRDVDAQPCLRPVRVELAPAGRESDCTARRERALVQGSAAFEDLPPGAVLTAIVGPGCAPAATHVQVAAARDSSETNVIVASPSAMPRVRGRIVDPGGTPWREFHVSAFTSSAGSAWAAQSYGNGAQADQDGVFTLDVPAWHAPWLNAKVADSVQLSLVARNAYGRAVVAEPIELADPPQSTPRELGDVRATDWPVLARGSVFDENERPLEGASVELCDASGAPDVRTRTMTDARGLFTLRGPASAGEELRVRATEPERRAADATVTLRRGEPRAHIVIAVHGRLAGSVLLPANAPASGVVVRLDQPSGAQLTLSVDETGSYAFSNVEPGATRVLFVPAGFEEPVLVLEQVGIPRGGASTDERLRGTDLRTKLELLELEVVDERGLPIVSGQAGPVSNDPVGEGRPRGRSYETVDGIARVLVPRGLARLQISAHGYEPVVLEAHVLLEAQKGRVRVPMRPSSR